MGRLFNSALVLGGATAIAAFLKKMVGSKTPVESNPSVESDAVVESILKELKDACDTPVDLLREIVNEMVSEMEKGLAESGESRLKMLPSYVHRLPDGSEKGVYYALDLGGTNFRVLKVMLGGREAKDEQDSVEVSIPQQCMTGSAKDLFDFIAEKLAEFVEKEDQVFVTNEGDVKKLGFTFSFPVDQTSIDSGKLVRWTKGFSIPEVEGEDVVQFLEKSFRDQNLNMKVSALVNDTVGTLAGAHYTNSNAKIAVILGTGTNACYVEKIDNIQKWKESKPPSGEMVINMEWGNFNSQHLPINYADKELDRESINPGEQVFEKLISGMYLGEIVRKVLLKLSNEAQLFGNFTPVKLTEPNSLSSPKLSKIDEDTTDELSVVSDVISKSFEIEAPSLKVRKVVQEVCEIVSRRGARLAAAGIVGVLEKIGRTKVVDGESGPVETMVAVDGGLYEHYAKFRNHMNAALQELLGADVVGNIRVELSNDGSGIGAALLAASCSHDPHAT